jgi:hypothetical protein
MLKKNKIKRQKDKKIQKTTKQKDNLIWKLKNF